MQALLRLCILGRFGAILIVLLTYLLTWSHVVCNKPAPAPSTCIGVISQRRDGWSCDVRPWLRPQHENSRSAKRVVLFCCTLSVATDSPAHTTFQTLVVGLVLSWLNYGNGVLIGLPTYLVRRLQSVLNASAGMISAMSLRPHNWCACQFSLAAHPVQDCRADV